MSISPISAPALPNSTPQVDIQTALQIQSRAQVAVPPTAVTASSKQEGSSAGFAKSDVPRGAPAGGRGRIVDITA